MKKTYMLKTVIVLGMHRSGTSLTSNILKELGVDMGNRLLGKNISNPFGHFEDLDFLELNQDILASAGGDYKNPPSRSAIMNQKEKYKNRIKKLIESKNIISLWGWKEPRTCLTFNLFLPYIENPHIIYCKRDAERIIKSLYKREKIERNNSLKIINIYKNEINDILRNYPNLKKIEIIHKELIGNPKAEINKIIKFIDIEPDKSKLNKAVKCIKSKSEIESKIKKIKNKNKIIKVVSNIKKIIYDSFLVVSC